MPMLMNVCVCVCVGWGVCIYECYLYVKMLLVGVRVCVPMTRGAIVRLLLLALLLCSFLLF